MTLTKDEVAFAVSAHQLYNSLNAGYRNNEFFSVNPYLTPEERAGFKQQGEYQKHLLEILFKVKK